MLTNDPRIVEIAGRLWAPARPGTGDSPPPVVLDVVVADDRRGQPPIDSLVERWTIGTDEAELELGDQIRASIDCARGRAMTRVSAGLLARDPALISRLALETPAGAILARRGYAVLHAGAVVGPAGAVVIRGAPGAGKSTLVAAAHRAGLGVLGDETILAAREDPDELLAGVRDLTLLPDATELLGLETAPATGVEGRGAKRRVDLFPTSSPVDRGARRIASVLLGPRDGMGRLEALTPGQFLDGFRAGEIPQERWSGTPEHIAAHWSRSGAFRLSGAADLDAAVALLAELVSAGAEARV